MVSVSVTRRLRPSSPLILALLLLASACSGVSPAEPGPRSRARPQARDRATTPSVTSAAASVARAPSPSAEVVQGRTVLTAPVPTNLPTAVEPLPADAAALLVSHAADEREGFVRWIDDAGQVGPIVRLVDEYVVTAFSRADKKRELVTSDGEKLCIARFAPDQTAAEARVCETIEAKALAVAGRKLAVISIEEHKTKVEKPRASVPARTTKPKSRRAPEKPAAKTPAKKKPATPNKKNPPKKKKGATKKAEKKIEFVIRRNVEVLAQWATSDGFGEAKKTGLKFVPPLDGMTIVDAKATPQGVVLAWFEKAKPTASAPKVTTKGPPALGWAAISSGIIANDGTFDEKSKKLVVEGELDWGFLRGFSGPRFVDMMAGMALLTQKTSRGGPCELTKIGDRGPLELPQSMCAIDPGAWPSVDTKAMEAIFQAGPKRRPGQPKYDAELVAWAGDSAYFVSSDGLKLHSAKRDGVVREEPAPFVARRARMTGAAIRPDGSGEVIVDGQLHRLDASGDVRLDDQPGKTLEARRAVDYEGRWKVKLPGGGSWLADRDRQRVIWLDKDGHEKAAATWPEGQSDAVCRDGLPGKRFVPSVVPGEFVDVPALAAPGICVVGEPVWAADGSLRWFGTFAEGLDILPEVRILRGLGKATATLVASAEPSASKKSPCPPEMVFVDGKLCVDRFEATLVDVESGREMSPDFPVTPNLFEIALGDWATGRSRVGSVFARAMPLPFVPEWQRGKKLDVMATPRPHVRPNGYLTGLVAESACKAAGKRLCTLDEFVLACRGEDDVQFPYGDTYVDGACNVNRDVHPAAMLHDNASIGHLDPRLNRVRVGGSTLLRETGATSTCRSRWGNDAIYDMVGNLDEWVDEEGGAFAGGFYARSTRAGCDAVITAHPKSYLDYSTGVRCCKDAAK